MRVSISFLKEHFCRNICDWNILLYFDLEGVENNEIGNKLYPPPTYQQQKVIHSCNYAIFLYKAVIKNKRKV